MNLRKLSVEEVEALESKATRKATGSRKVMAELYDSLVSDFDVGEYAVVELGAGEKKATVKKHIKAALGRRGLNVEWRRGGKDTLKYHVVE